MIIIGSFFINGYFNPVSVQSWHLALEIVLEFTMI